jgi:hypothetical protein
MYKEPPFQGRGLFLKVNIHKYYTCDNVLCTKKNMFSPLLVKNKPHDGELKHVFTLGSRD